MVKKPDVLSDEEIREIIVKGWCSPETTTKDIYPEPWDYAVAQAQLDVCVEYYEPLIKEMYEAVKFFIADHLTEYEYLDKGISSATKRGKKLLAFREALAKAEGK